MVNAQLHGVLRHLQGLRDARAVAEAPDAQLLEWFARGHEEAPFAALVRRHGPMVWAVSRRVLPQVQDAEDVFQATFLVLARKAASIRKAESVGGWLYGVARRLALKARLQQARRQAREKRAADMRQTQAGGETSLAEVQEALDAALGELPEKYRAALVLCYLEGNTQEEAARRLGCPLATLRTRVARGRKLLRERLVRHGLTLSVAGLATLLIASAAPAAAPAALVQAAVRAALPFAAGQPAAALCSTQVAGLVEGGLRAMFLGKVEVATMLLVAATVISAAYGLARSSASGDEAQATPGRPANPQASLPQASAPRHSGKEEKETVLCAGRVLDAAGRPVAGAKFAVIDDETGTPVPQIASDPQGRFTFRMARPHSVRDPRQVVASAPGFGVDWLSEPRNDAVFHLVPDLPISGRVIDLQGRPVAGATVAVHNVHTGPAGAFDELLQNRKRSAREQEQAARKLDHYLWNRGGLGQVFHATTAADGTFTLSGLGKDRVVTLLVSGAGIADTFADVATRPGFDPSGPPRSPLRLCPPNFSLVVAPGKPVTGVVRDEKTKAPLRGVRVAGASFVSLLEDGDFHVTPFLFHAWPTPAAVTDAEGRFTLRGLAKAPAYILVADPDEGTEHLHRFGYVRDTDGFAAVKCDIDLPRGVILTGRVTDAVTGAGVPSRVFYRPLENNALLDQFPGYAPPDLPAPWHRGRDTKTDLDGRYKLTVMPGAGVLLVQAFGAYQSAQATRQETAEGIVDTRFGFFRAVGQGGMFRPGDMSAYKVISPAATARTARFDVTVRPAAQPKPDGSKERKASTR